MYMMSTISTRHQDICMKDPHTQSIIRRSARLCELRDLLHERAGDMFQTETAKKTLYSTRTMARPHRESRMSS